jgi:biopolymer transport protein ExbD
MVHPHRHLGAEDVITGAVPHARPELNITPLIDVLIVLIRHLRRCVAADAEALDVSLPVTASAHDSPANSAFIVLDYSENGVISVNHKAIALANLEQRLRTIFTQCRDKTMFRSQGVALQEHR